MNELEAVPLLPHTSRPAAINRLSGVCPDTEPGTLIAGLCDLLIAAGRCTEGQWLSCHRRSSVRQNRPPSPDDNTLVFFFAVDSPQQHKYYDTSVLPGRFAAAGVGERIIIVMSPVRHTVNRTVTVSVADLTRRLAPRAATDGFAA